MGRARIEFVDGKPVVTRTKTVTQTTPVPPWLSVVRDVLTLSAALQQQGLPHIIKSPGVRNRSKALDRWRVRVFADNRTVAIEGFDQESLAAQAVLKLAGVQPPGRNISTALRADPADVPPDDRSELVDALLSENEDAAAAAAALIGSDWNDFEDATLEFDPADRFE
jgi:hypothetical protein